MVRIRPQTLRTGSMTFALLLLILKVSLTTATPPLAQASVDDDSAPPPEELPYLYVDTPFLDTDSEGSSVNCSLNEQLDGDVCVCVPGFVVDPTADPDAEGCPCRDVCSDSMKCPSGTTCRVLGCGAGYKCECKEGIYDVDTKTCINACTMYGDAVCSLPGQTCIKNGLYGFKCECREGYKPAQDGKSCEDIDECADTATACPSGNEVCTNTPGSRTCTCKEGFVRNERGRCEIWEKCDNPSWNSCAYKCERETADPDITCSCPEGFNLQDNGGCIIDDPKNQCQCETLEEGTWYCRKNTDEVDVCSPKNGYEISEKNETMDIDECKEHPDLCGLNSACTNTKGKAICACADGFVPSSPYVNGSFCVAKTCSPGQVLLGSECVDPCSSSPCGGLGDTYTCRATEDGTPECYCGEACTNQLQSSPDISVYKGSLTVLQLPGALENSGYSRRVLASSLEAIFGRGTIDVTLQEKTFLSEETGGQEPTTTLTAVFDLLTKASYEDADDVAIILSSNCFATKDDRCPLPGNVVLSRKDIAMLDNSDPCKQKPCQYPYTECKNNKDLYGRYTCECVAGFEPTGLPGACKDVDECLTTEVTCPGKCINTPGSYYCEKKPETHEDELRKQLDDSEHTLTVVSAVLGTFLGLALVSTLVFVVLYVKRSKVPKTANISPDL